MDKGNKDDDLTLNDAQVSSSESAASVDESVVTSTSGGSTSNDQITENIIDSTTSGTAEAEVNTEKIDESTVEKAAEASVSSSTEVQQENELVEEPSSTSPSEISSVEEVVSSSMQESNVVAAESCEADTGEQDTNLVEEAVSNEPTEPESTEADKDESNMVVENEILNEAKDLLEKVTEEVSSTNSKDDMCENLNKIQLEDAENVSAPVETVTSSENTEVDEPVNSKSFDSGEVEMNDKVEESSPKIEADNYSHDEDAESVEYAVSHDDEDYDTLEDEYQDAEGFSGDDYAEKGDEEDEEAPEDAEIGQNVDEDEDRKNPQYIPKKGMFYEHDDRLSEVPVEEEQESVEGKDDQPGKPGAPVGRGKKLWKADTDDHWGHDKFREDDQMPKALDELVNVYGYNIREESGPPRARRRRRYGRGPNKYVRSWEDEQAYSSRGKRSFRGRGRGFRGRSNPRNDSDGSIEDINAETKGEFEKNDFPALGESHDVKPSPTTNPRFQRTKPTGGRRFEDRGRGLSNRMRPPAHSSLVHKEEMDLQAEGYSKSRSATRPANRRIRGAGNSGRTFTRSGVSREKEDDSLDHRNEPVSSSNRVIEPTNSSNASRDANSRGREVKGSRPLTKSIPPRMNSRKSPTQSDASMARPKRYSSLRQRNAAESSNYQGERGNQVHQFYDSSSVYNESGGRHHNSRSNGPSGTRNATDASSGRYHAKYESSAYTPIPPSLPNSNPSAAQIYNAAQPLQSAFIAPSPNNMNYGPPPATAASYGGTVAPFTGGPAAPYQGSQPPYAATPPSVPVSQPQEVYHGGMAFYNTHTQSMGRNAPSKRPKAAIPIVPPPDRLNGVEQPDKFESVEFTLNNDQPPIENSTEGS